MKTEYTDYIEHPAVVVDTDVRRGILKVRVDDSGECGGCPAARLCSLASVGDAEKKSGLLDIRVRDVSAFRKGDKVTVRGTERMHRRAIMLATVFPSVALVAVMTAIFLLTSDQLAAALGGLGATVFFFALLYVCRNRIAHEFSFEVKDRR